MHTSLAQQIDQLLIDSGLFCSQKQVLHHPSHFNFKDQTILITGAAGTIGSELSKQLMSSSFKQLILVDMAESPLYNLIKTLEFKNKERVKFLLININDIEALDFLFKTYNPTIVLHAAAYKHVPLMESHPFEAIRTNIFGTKALANMSILHRVQTFVFVSTDKAVNPKGVMGLTKRIAEKHLNYLNSKHKTAFFNTRFGNILGSNGSVVPLVKDQIKRGAPITLTCKDISRYFICKRKACNLILKITQLNKSKYNTFTFNMGQPIKIIDLIERLAKFHNKELNELNIIYTGLRPGEKLFEDMVSENEILEPTIWEDIFTVKEKNKTPVLPVDFSLLNQITHFTPKTTAKSILKSLL